MITLREKVGRSLKEKEKLTRREKLNYFLPIIALTVIAFFIAFQFVDPAPPKAIAIACGPQEGANCIFAKAYAEFLAREGVTLNIKATAGSVENLELLQVENDGVEVAFVQGGLKSLVQNGHLMSLGSLYFEPLWIFYHSELAIERTSNMKGLRIAVGEEGSGTKILAMHLLQLNGIDSENTRLVSV